MSEDPHHLDLNCNLILTTKKHPLEFEIDLRWMKYCTLSETIEFKNVINIERIKEIFLLFTSLRSFSTRWRSAWIDQSLLYVSKIAPPCEIQDLCPRKQPSSIPYRLLCCFTDPLIAWTYYCSSDLLSTELRGHYITREIWMHTVYRSFYVSLFHRIPTHPCS